MSTPLFRRPWLSPFTVLALAAASMFGCSARQHSDTDASGAIGLALQIVPGTTLNSFSYAITGPGGFAKSGSGGLVGSTQLMTVIGGLPAGSGFAITIDSTSTDGNTHCGGTAMFAIAARTTTSVVVKLTCHEAPRTGAVSINGVLNVCPLADGISASPADVLVGGTIALSATAHDTDGVPAPLTYAWTTTTGTLSNATTQAPTLTCAAAGPVTVALFVTDSDCSDSLSVTVNCSLPTYHVVINEVESNGGVPGDWIELHNTGPGAVDISGWKVKDNDDSHAFSIIPAGTILAPGGYYVVEEAQLGFGLGAPDSARLWDAAGFPVDSYSWTTHATTTYGRCPNGAGALVTTLASTKGAANSCGAVDAGTGGTGGAGVDASGGAGGTSGADAASGPDGVVVHSVVINEVESNGGTPDDWVELYNTGAAPVDITGWKIKDNDDTHPFFIIPATTLAPGGYYTADVAATFGLGAADSVRLWDAAGNPIETYSWTSHAVMTYGRCPNGTGSFVDTAASTKGAANGCGAAPDAGAADSAGTSDAATTALAWPGTDMVITVDDSNYFGANLSGLHYQPAAGAAPAVLWGVQNSPSKLFRLLWNATTMTWQPDPSNGWSGGNPSLPNHDGKLLHYTNGMGAPDSEGVSKAEWTDAAIYVATERDNNASGVSRLSILRFDTAAATAELTATNDWNVTADLPAQGANLGLEAITYIPDTALVAGGFFDEATNATYNPATYPNHGTGLFLVGVEGNGVVYGYALNHVTNGFVRVATLASGQVGIMDLSYDRETSLLWGYCDNTCNNKATVFKLDTGAMSPTKGRFQIGRVFNGPSTLGNSNNEGITFAPEAECSSGQKNFFWSDDDQLDGHAIRRGTIPCGSFF